eukprot:1738891-Ditylum_brightwellii.AAC.1
MHRPRALSCQPIRRTTSTGHDGKHLLEEWDSQTHSLMDLNPTSRSGSCAHLWSQCAEEITPEDTKRALNVVPL